MRTRFSVDGETATRWMPDGLVSTALTIEAVVMVWCLLHLLAGLVDEDVEISYIVTGDRPATFLAVTTPNGSENYAWKPLPFKGTYKFEEDEFVSITAGISSSRGEGTITCTVVEDGKVVQQTSSTGPIAIAVCDGWAGKGKAVPGAKIPQVSTPAHP